MHIVIRALFLTPLVLQAAQAAELQAAPIPMEFFEIRIAEPRHTSYERHQDIVKFLARNQNYEVPFANREVIMAASLLGEAMNVEGLNLSDVTALTQEEYCIRTVEIGALPIFAENQSLVACEYTTESINAIRVNAGLMPVHIP
jgi:hypothetical protein